MTLHKKTKLIINISIITFIITLFAAAEFITHKSIDELEEKVVNRNVEHVQIALSREISFLNKLAIDWASWDDTYAFIQDANETYIKSNLDDRTFADQKLNMILFINSSGRIVYGKGFDVQENKEISIPKSIMGHVSANSLLLRHLNTESSISGIITLPEGPMIITSRPILTSKNKGPIRGTLIIGRYLDATQIKHLSEIVNFSLIIRDIKHTKMPPDFQEALPLLEEKPVFVRPLGKDFIAGYTILKDIYGKPSLMLKVGMLRENYQTAQTAMIYVLLLLLITGFLISRIIQQFLDKVILSRLANLSASVSSIGEGGNLSARLPLMNGQDEIINLASNINEMLAALDQSQKSEERYRNLADKLRTSRQQFQDIIEFLPDPTFVIDNDKKVIAWNRAIEKMTGISKGDILGKGDYVYSVPLYGSQIPMLIDLIGSEDREAEQKYEYVKRKGNTLFAEVFAPSFYGGKGAYLWGTASPLYDNAGNLVGAIESMRDVTERKQMEQEIILQKAHFQQLFENSPEAIVMLDNSDKIININRGFEKIFRYSLDEVKGLYINEVIIPERLQKEAAYISASLLGGEICQKETVRQRKDGSLVDVHILGYPIIVGSKQVGIYMIYSDITERKQDEKQLQYLSLHDPLTGLYNRAYFEQEMSRLEDGRHSLVGVILCDVDGLKLVNDTLGHKKGDEILVAAAGLIKNCFRQSDMAARIGGDEFAVLLPNSNPTDVESAVQRINNAIIGYNEVNPELPLSISVGFTIGSEAPVSMVDLFKEADNNMYREKLHRSQSARSAMVQTLMKALEARDFITEGHADRLQDLVVGVARAIGLPENKTTDLRLLAQFHDIGKVGVPDRILFKEGPLTSEEFEEMQRHSEIGYRIAQSAPDLVPIADWILKHHEWWNGKGYPFGLNGKEIPMECRILAIADAYDAMTSDRPYRKAMSHEKATAELRRCAGVQFDPWLVDKFMEVLEGQNNSGVSDNPK